ncbi:MAG TPA: glycosyltransferase family 87 protein [Parvibaculum sp.]
MFPTFDNRKHGPAFQPNGWHLLMVLCASLLACHLWVLGQSLRGGLWIVGLDGVPRQIDFNAYWAAGRFIAEGHAASAYNATELAGLLTRNFGDALAGANFPFFYPPLFLFAVAPLGLFPYALAAALWIGATLVAYLAAMRAILPRREILLLALAAPAMLWCICVGQNGLLTAALAGGALALLDRRPVAAGILFGALAYKPQFGVLIPLVLVATGRWRTFFSAAATVAALLALSGFAFGWNVFPAFIDAMNAANASLLGRGALPWFKMQSVYGFVRMLGFGAPAAWAVHGAIALAVAAATLALWRSKASPEIKAAALATAMLVVSPYSCIYDLPLVTVPVVFLIRDGLARPLSLAEKLALGAAYMLPLVFPEVHFPVGPAIYLLLTGVIFVRWRQTSPFEHRFLEYGWLAEP